MARWHADIESIEKEKKNKQTKFDEEQFVKDIFNNRYILVIGNEGLLNMNEFGDRNGDINQYILHDILNKTVFLKTKPYGSFSELEATTKHWELVRENYLQRPERRVKVDDISPQIQKLIETRMFRIVFTTCYEDILEKVMLNTWDGNVRVVDINEEDSLRNFQDAIIDSIEERGNETYITYDEPTLFYIFGKAVDKKDCHIVLSDNDAIRMINRWMIGQKFGKHFINFIMSKQIMALGCNFEDWYMRFFWFILKRDINKMSQGQLISSVVGDETTKLVSYLEQNGIYHEADMQSFISRITELLTTSIDNSPMKERIIRYRRRGSIFLSYNNHIFNAAIDIFMKLYKDGYGVWFDNHDLFGGDDYDNRIYKAIYQCKVFIPILSKETAEFMKNYHPNTDFNTLPYVVREWILAARSGSCKIIPLALPGFPLYDGVYKQVFEEMIIGHACSAIEFEKKDWLTKLKDSIKDALKNNNADRI